MELGIGESLVDEILSQECKEIKNRLLSVLVVSLAIVKGGLLPKSISALGIDLTVDNSRNFLVKLILIVCIYFLLLFIQKAITDYIKWKMDFYTVISRKYESQGMISSEETTGRINVPGHNDKIDSFLKIVEINNCVRIMFEIGLTVILAVISIILILIDLYN